MLDWESARWLCVSVLAAGAACAAPLHGQNSLPLPVQGQDAAPASLPDSPGTLLAQAAAPPSAPAGNGSSSSNGTEDSFQRLSSLPPCDKQLEPVKNTQGGTPNTTPGPSTLPPRAVPAAQPFAGSGVQPAPCPEKQVQPILSASLSHPLSNKQKGELALRDTVDPFNLMTIALYSGFAVGLNAHSAYGPGFEGWGRLSGYSLVEDAQGEFFGTFLISSLTHEDPRYHRMPNAPVKKRILHALSHTWVSQHDDGRPMPNYATLLTYPFSAELSNLYVPGVPTNLHDTGERVAIGLATDPSGTLIAEFLPDFAKKIHIHVIFIQEILNQVITGGTAPNVQ